MWTIQGTLDESSFLDDAVSEIITAEDIPLPSADSKFGHVELHWDDVGDGQAFLQARGGTVDDRTLARMVLVSQLASHGFTEASYSFDGFKKTADWADIMEKARRLRSSGAVQILRNGYNNVVALVQGDHGKYQSEIFRSDPNSRAITGSDCECGWGEFQNTPRSREFQKFQDRPCSHILAAFWHSQSMPLDEDAHPGAPGPDDGSGGQGAGPGGSPTMGPEADQGFDPAQRSFDPSMAEGQSAGPGTPPGGSEAPPGPSPADVLPQYPMEQMQQPQPHNLVSDPAFMQGPTPTNPVANPPGGAFSSVQPDPWASWHFGINLGDLSAPTPEPDIPNPGTGDTPLNNGDLVQLRYPDKGTQVGRSEAHGAGQPIDLTPGMVGEVRGVDPATGMVEVLYTGGPFRKNKKMEPFGATATHFPRYVIPRPDLRKPGPAIKRTRP